LLASASCSSAIVGRLLAKISAPRRRLGRIGEHDDGRVDAPSHRGSSAVIGRQRKRRSISRPMIWHSVAGWS
jgi:hypothetical protein